MKNTQENVELNELLADFAADIFDEGITVSISRNDAIKLFVAIISANVATVFVFGAFSAFIKKSVKNTDEKDAE